jgi:hypothetical protein
MNTRGAGLAAVGAALIALVSACGGSAVAADIAPTAEPVDVEDVARAEIAAIEAAGYPTELAQWVFDDHFENQWGGTAATSQQADLTSIITLDVNPDAYLQYDDDIAASIRSTVRHEFGHALTFYIYPTGANAASQPWCTDTTEASEDTKVPYSECAAEAISAVLAEDAADTRVAFYGLGDISQGARDYARTILVESRVLSAPATS